MNRLFLFQLIKNNRQYIISRLLSKLINHLNKTAVKRASVCMLSVTFSAISLCSFSHLFHTFFSSEVFQFDPDIFAFSFCFSCISIVSLALLPQMLLFTVASLAPIRFYNYFLRR